MRIMYLLFSFTVGGTERLVIDICNEMANKHKVYLYVVNDHYSVSMLKALSPKVHVELQKRPCGNKEKLRTLYYVSKFVIHNHIEIIHCNSFNAPELLIFKPIFFKNTIVIQTIHDVGQFENCPKWKILLRNYICNSFIAISKSVECDIIKSGIKKNKVTLVYNAIDLNKFNNNYKKFDVNQVVIGNVARFVPEKKGQDILVDAIYEVKKVYPNVKCFFAGGYDKEHLIAFEYIYNKVKELHLDKNIFFLGSIDDIPAFLRTIDIFVLPSRYEGFGLSLIEAMAMGVPCIASDLYGPAEIIGNNERGLIFKTENVQHLADRIIEVISHYQIYKENAMHEVLDYVHLNYDIQKMCDRLVKVYKGEEIDV